MPCSIPNESVETIAKRTVYTRTNAVIAEWLELIGLDSTRFDLLMPGARILLTHTLAHIPEDAGCNPLQLAPIAYTTDAAGNAVPLMRR